METFTFNIPKIASITPIEFVTNFFLCVIASFVLKMVYLHCAKSLTGRQHIAPIIPLMSLITFLIIMVVKSSLALSLGLVGALSIVRFRTPIKEPEELVYLFLSISIGLGYGAGLTLITTSTYIIIIFVIFILSKNKANISENTFNLVLDIKKDNLNIDEIIFEIQQFCIELELIKFSSSNNTSSLFLKIEIQDLKKLSELEKKIKSIDKKATIIFSDSKPMQ